MRAASASLGEHSQLFGDLVGQTEPVARLHVLEHLGVGEALVGKTAERHDLVHDHPETPDVRLGRKDSVTEALGTHPPNWQHAWKHVLFNDAVNTFYLQLYGVRHGKGPLR